MDKQPNQMNFYNQDLHDENVNSIEDSIPIVHLSPHNEYGEHLNTNFENNFGETNTLTMDGTPHCRHKPPMP